MKNYYNQLLSKNYESFTINGKYYNYKKDADEIAKVISGKDILEIGIGSGLLANILIDRGFNVEGIEPSAHMLKIIKKKFPKIKVVKQDLVHLNMRKKYDAIISHGTFPLISIRKGIPYFDCFVNNDKEILHILTLVKRHLKNNGLFISNVQSDKQENKKIRNIYKNELLFKDNFSLKKHYFYINGKWKLTQTIKSVVCTEEQFNNLLAKAGFSNTKFNKNKTVWIAK